MSKLGIKQLTGDLIEQRLLIFRAWKLAGGGVRWQQTADIYETLSGRRITRQAVKDMIERLGKSKIIRRRGKANKVTTPLDFDDV